MFDVQNSMLGCLWSNTPKSQWEKADETPDETTAWNLAVTINKYPQQQEENILPYTKKACEIMDTTGVLIMSYVADTRPVMPYLSLLWNHQLLYQQ